MSRFLLDARALAGWAWAPAGLLKGDAAVRVPRGCSRDKTGEVGAEQQQCMPRAVHPGNAGTAAGRVPARRGERTGAPLGQFRVALSLLLCPMTLCYKYVEFCTFLPI